MSNGDFNSHENGTRKKPTFKLCSLDKNSEQSFWMNFAIKFLNEVKIFFHGRSKLVLHSVMSLPAAWPIGLGVGFVFFFFYFFFCSFLVFLLIFFIACVASVSVWFRSKKRLRNDSRKKILGFGRARNETSAKKLKRGRGGEERKFPSFLPHPLPTLLLSPVWLSFPVLCS